MAYVLVLLLCSLTLEWIIAGKSWEQCDQMQGWCSSQGQKQWWSGLNRILDLLGKWNRQSSQRSRRRK